MAELYFSTENLLLLQQRLPESYLKNLVLYLFVNKDPKLQIKLSHYDEQTDPDSRFSIILDKGRNKDTKIFTSQTTTTQIQEGIIYKTKNTLIIHINTEAECWMKNNIELFKTKSALAIRDLPYLWEGIDDELKKKISNNDFISYITSNFILKSVDSDITTLVKRQYDRTLERLRDTQENLLMQYRENLEEEYRLNQKCSNPIATFANIIPLAEQLKQQNYLHNIVVYYPGTEQVIISFVWQPLQLEYYDLAQTKKWLAQLTKSSIAPKEVQFLEDALLNKKYKAFIAPLTTKMYITQKYSEPKIDWISESPSSSGTFPYQLCDYFNLHAFMSDWRGCLGTFGPVIHQALATWDLRAFLLNILQFYKTINMLDGVAGTPTFTNRTVYTDLDNVIVESPWNNSKPFKEYIGKNIYDLVTPVKGGII